MHKLLRAPWLTALVAKPATLWRRCRRRCRRRRRAHYHFRLPRSVFYLGRIFVQINRFHSNSTDSAYLIDVNDVGTQHTSERDRDREKEKDNERDFKMGSTKRDREIYWKKIKCVGVKRTRGVCQTNMLMIGSSSTHSYRVRNWSASHRSCQSQNYCCQPRPNEIR